MDKTHKQPKGSRQSGETALIAHNKPAHVTPTGPPGEPLPFEVATTQGQGNEPPDFLSWYAGQAVVVKQEKRG